MASSSIRQPEAVLVSVASPLAPGTSPVGCEGGVEALARGSRIRTRPPRWRPPAQRSPGRRSERDDAAPGRGAHVVARRYAPVAPPVPRPRSQRSARARPPAVARQAGRPAPKTPRLALRARHDAPTRATRPQAPPARPSPRRLPRLLDDLSSTQQTKGSSERAMASRRALRKAGAWRARRVSRASELSGPTPDRESRCKRRAKPREQCRKPHALDDPASAEFIPTADRTPPRP